MSDWLRTLETECHGSLRSTVEEVERERVRSLVQLIRQRILNIWLLQNEKILSPNGLLIGEFPHKLKKEGKPINKEIAQLLDGFQNGTNVDRDVFQKLYDNTVQNIPEEIAVIKNGDERGQVHTALHNVFMAIISQSWTLHKYPDSVNAYGFFISCLLQLTLHSPAWTEQTHMILADLETPVADFFFFLGKEFPNLDRNIDELASEKRKVDSYKVRGKSKTKTVSENSHTPVVLFIKAKAGSGCYNKFSGKMPGELAEHIRDDIQGYNRDVKKEEQKLHPYRSAQMKKILEKYFGFKAGKKLPSPLKFK